VVSIAGVFAGEIHTWGQVADSKRLATVENFADHALPPCIGVLLKLLILHRFAAATFANSH
jgi:hypothetical protein